MSSAEIIVILFGLFMGYWVVSKLFLGGGKPPVRDGKGPEISQRVPEPQPVPQPWYEVLELSPQASVEEIRRAYQTLISKYHPDKVATLGDELKALAERKSVQINSAYTQALLERGPRA